MLHTGGNFGCTAFCYTIFRLIEQYKLDPRVERIVRQTDGGSDNVSWVTHALHYMLVREGVFNQINWVRLRPVYKEIINSIFSQPCYIPCVTQDRFFSLIESIFYPKRGFGPGYKSPLEFQAMLVKGLQEKERFWRYIYDPDFVDLTDQSNKVRVIFKTNLTDKATNEHSEFKPHPSPASDGAQMQTDPSG
eukprot:2727783-Pleurochrysis_carterae.AAC.4